MTEAGELPYYRGLFEGLRRLGFVEGQNLQIERFSGQGQTEHFPELAREVIHVSPDLVFVASTRLTFVFK